MGFTVNGATRGFLANGVSADIGSRYRRTVVGPNPYAAGGIPVDVSASFLVVSAVNILRAYVTSTKQGTGRLFEVVETGTDTFANRKFRIMVRNPFKAHTPTAIGAIGTLANAAPNVTTDADVLKASGAAASVSNGNTGSACIATCSPSHHPVVSNLVQASGAAKVAAVLTVAAPALSGAPTVTVDAIAAAVGEEVGAIDLSGVTIEYEVVGVPA